jgi:AcrR family transcriptional regulator
MTDRPSMHQAHATAVRPRAMRADALRNRQVLLDAARMVFQRDGLAAQMDDIAQSAGLGVGTLYRHFPTREALIDVLIQERLDRLVASAAAAERTDDPWVAVSGLVWQFATFEAEDRGMVDILAAQGTPGAAAAMAEVMQRLHAVVTRAQAAGVMRPEVSAEDVLTAVCGVGKMMRPDDDPDRWRRLVSVILDGLRSTAASGGRSQGASKRQRRSRGSPARAIEEVE